MAGRCSGGIIAVLAMFILVPTSEVAGPSAVPHPAAENIRLPDGVNTDQGWMDVEAKYVPGVVAAEIGGVTESAAALRAQAIAARTYLLRFLNENGMGATVPIGPRFQAWIPGFTAREIDAAGATAGIVMVHSGLVIHANYASGAKVGPGGAPLDPSTYGYCSDVAYADWESMRDAFRNGRRFTGADNYCGSGNAWAWTEVYVTQGSGGKTLQNWPDERNRGALGQWKAKFVGESGWTEDRILRFFYSCVDLVRDGGTGTGTGGLPVGGRHCSVDLGPPAR